MPVSKQPDKHFLEGIGKRIKEIRVAKNITQQNLADVCDFEKASVSRLEAGKTNPTLLTLNKVGKALGVHIKVFFEE